MSEQGNRKLTQKGDRRKLMEMDILQSHVGLCRITACCISIVQYSQDAINIYRSGTDDRRESFATWTCSYIA